ncbi:hypothetical protein HN385_02670 [archaeon]|jgi:hypothetical protein|nr:hypothetical protein [archaeon]MBT3450654.1 hypothetical protein [archaeon]MBT6868766.1 hypothetical protein [archaeon]MBT7193013.1 hypothetical protein [archaeon]MBT7380979.1 hypothetical protein [archaeon]
MVYIRIKKISGNEYAYLVESIQTKKGSRQKVKKYLGKVYKFENKNISDVDKLILSRNRASFLKDLVLRELVSIGFKDQEKYCNLKLLMFDKNKLTLHKKTKSKTVKDAIISLNNGFLCSFTLQRILEFKKSKDVNQDAPMLAKYFLEAGLQVSKENFVKYYMLKV